MKRMIFLSFTFLIFNNFFLFSFEIGVKDIQEELLKHFTLYHDTHQGRNFYAIRIVDEIEPDKPLSKLCNEFVKANNLYLDYIARATISLFEKDKDDIAQNPEAVRKRFEELKRENDKFLESVTELFGLYLKAKGHEVSEWKENSIESYSVDDLKSIAIRFILPFKITDKGGIATRICVAGEGLQDYSERNIHLEAFSFDTIFNDIKKKDNQVFKHLEEYTKLAKRLKLSTNEEDALKRAQGIIWILFFKDESFEKMLLDGYKKKSDYLPFKILGDPSKIGIEKSKLFYF